MIYFIGVNLYDTDTIKICHNRRGRTFSERCGEKTVHIPAEPVLGDTFSGEGDRQDYCAVKLKSDEKMTIGYIAREDAVLSPIGEKYLQEIMKYREENCNGKKN